MNQALYHSTDSPKNHFSSKTSGVFSPSCNLTWAVYNEDGSVSRKEKTAPIWREEINRKLEELKNLEQGWDSYDGSPICPDLIDKASKFLEDQCLVHKPEPYIVPVGNGGLNVEWRSDGNILSIKFRESETTYMLVNKKPKFRWTGEVTKSDLSHVFRESNI